MTALLGLFLFPAVALAVSSVREDEVVLDDGAVIRGFVLLDDEDARRGFISLDDGSAIVFFDSSCAVRRIPRGQIRKLSRLKRPPDWKPPCTLQPEPPRQYRPRQYRWYGYQTLLVDAASITVGALALLHAGDPYAGHLDSPARVLGMIAGAGYLFGPATVHALQGRSEVAWRSITLRLGLPLAGALIGLALGAGGGLPGPTWGVLQEG